MRKSLESFIEKTATSRDANEFLLRFSRVEAQNFLLLIVCIKTQDELDALMVQISDLLSLDLLPSIWLHSDLCSTEFSLTLKERFDGKCIIRSPASEKSWPESLREDVKKNSFYKIVWTGGSLKNLKGEVIDRVHLSHDQVSWDVDSEKTLKWISPLLQGQGPSSSIQCVEPELVMSELFTRRGSGTLVSQGYFFKWSIVEDLDKLKMVNLIEAGFGRQLKSNYLSELPDGTKVLHEREYRGGVVLIPAPGFTYLDKVVVESKFLGRGMGSLLLDELMANLNQPGHGRLAWRARHDNPYLGRYAQVVHAKGQGMPGSCGTISDGHYIYHYIGVDAKDLPDVIGWMSEYCSSFVDG